MIEAGLANFVVVGWYGIFTTAGTPQSSIAKLHSNVWPQPECVMVELADYTLHAFADTFAVRSKAFDRYNG